MGGIDGRFIVRRRACIIGPENLKLGMGPVSVKHPIITVTGSSGAGSDTVKDAFTGIFHRLGLLAAYIDGDSFHRYSRAEMKEAVAEAAEAGNPHLSHFGPEANHFDKQEELFSSYADNGTGRRRLYLHDEAEAEPYGDLGAGPGDFTPWEDIPAGTDLMFYEGLHGNLAADGIDIAQYPDLKIGVVPVINLEWMQKIQRDTAQRGYSEEEVMDTILRRMHDYVHYIIPQFKGSDINFQRVPVVDTSYPIVAKDVPTLGESVVVIRFRHPGEFDVDFPMLLQRLDNSWMSRRNAMVIPGIEFGLALEYILTPIVERMMEKKKQATGCC